MRVLFVLVLVLILNAGANEPSFKLEDFQLAPIHVHLLASKEIPELCTTLTEADIERILSKVNRVWSQAGLGFYLASIEKDTPVIPITDFTVKPKANRTLLDFIPPKTYRENEFNVYYLKAFTVNGIYFPRAIFVKDTAALRPVEGGIDEPLPRVTSHELGHALGLPHRQDVVNLMASGTTGTSLNDAEIETTRAKAKELGRFKSASELLNLAGSLAADGHEKEAAQLRRVLAALPVDSELLKPLRTSPAQP